MKYGFTLIELLAVIVILAIILVIAVPQINKVIEDTKISSMESSAILVAKNIEETISLNENKPNTIDCLDSTYGIKSSEYTSCIASIKYDDNITVEVSLIGNGKYNGLVANGTSNKATITKLDSNNILLKDTLISAVNGKDIDVNKYAGNGLYKWGSKYIYRGGITKTNANGLATTDYVTDVDSGSEVSNYIKVPWENYTANEDCTSTTNKCYRIMSINDDGSITIVRDKNYSSQRFDNTINTTARTHYSNYTNTYGYNDLLSNTPTSGHSEEYRPYSEMYTYLYGTSGYQNAIIKPYSSMLQPIDVCINKVNNYASLNRSDYSTTTYVKDTCNISGKPNTTAVNSLQNQYVRLPYMEEYLNTSTESTCTADYQYQCRNQNYMYNKLNYWSLNGYSSYSWHARFVFAYGSADTNSAYLSFGVRPVVTLKNNVLITGGSGTQASPYIIKY